MLEWIVALVLLVCLVAYVLMDYKTKGKAKRALLALHAENKQLHQYIEWYITQKKPDTTFAATFEAEGIESIENTLQQMIARAQSEIVIVSPWLKEAAWLRIRDRVARFCQTGGTVKVFIRGIDEDFSSSRCDRSVVDEIKMLGGAVIAVPQLHAKLYVIDRREALITSVNLTGSGLDFGYEAGVWTCNPLIVEEACRFVDKLAG